MRPIRHIGREHTASPGWPLSGLDGQWLLLAGLRLSPVMRQGRPPPSVSPRPTAVLHGTADATAGDRVDWPFMATRRRQGFGRSGQ